MGSSGYPVGFEVMLRQYGINPSDIPPYLRPEVDKAI
jgi:hypothetical protein